MPPPPERRETRTPWPFAPVDNAFLVFFRVAFGGIMFWEVLRYFGDDASWIRQYWIEPAFHFTYYGFSWVEPWPGDGMYWHFRALGLVSLCIAIGLFYRLAATLLFLGFTYVFLLEQARYLNHFYLISLLAFLAIFLPANRALALDARLGLTKRSAVAPAWTLYLLRAQIGIVYFFGGIAKLNGDWLRGEPVREWLRRRTDYPVLGQLFDEEWMVWGVTYGGLLLDLFAPFLLLWRRTRIPAFVLVVAFHLTNAWLFNIGIFPWFMIAATTVFFEPDWCRRILPRRFRRERGPSPAGAPGWTAGRKVTATLLAAYLAMQILVPLRHWLYPGNVNWTEEGHRFAWHMKLRDKQASAAFVVIDPESGWSDAMMAEQVVEPWQARKMAARPDMVLQLAHHLAEQQRAEGREVEVYAQVMASLNGRRHRPLVDEKTDLAAQPRDLRHAKWISPLDEPLPRPER